MSARPTRSSVAVGARHDPMVFFDAWDFAMEQFALLFACAATMTMALSVGHDGQRVRAILRTLFGTGNDRRQKPARRRPPALRLLCTDGRRPCFGATQSVRDILRFYGFDFEDATVAEAPDGEGREAEPNLGVPNPSVLHVSDGSAEDHIHQSKAMLRYVGRLSKSYPPSTLVDAARIDQWCELHTAFVAAFALHVSPTSFGVGSADVCDGSHRRWLCDVHLPRHLRQLENALENDVWIAGTPTVTIADFCWYATLRWLFDGGLDGAGAHDFERFPTILLYMDEMKRQLEPDDVASTGTEGVGEGKKKEL